MPESQVETRQATWWLLAAVAHRDWQKALSVEATESSCYHLRHRAGLWGISSEALAEVQRFAGTEVAVVVGILASLGSGIH